MRAGNVIYMYSCYLCCERSEKGACNNKFPKGIVGSSLTSALLGNLK